MELAKGIVSLGCRIECDNCKHTKLLPMANDLDSARFHAEKSGWVFEEARHFCNENCLSEFRGEVCQHAWPRSGPNAFVCVKCGKHRDEV